MAQAKKLAEVSSGRGMKTTLRKIDWILVKHIEKLINMLESDKNEESEIENT